jgi:hypothetical protein
MNKDAYTKAFLQAAEIPLTEKTIKEYKAVWWWSFRKKDQVKIEGNRILKKHVSSPNKRKKAGNKT